MTTELNSAKNSAPEQAAQNQPKNSPTPPFHLESLYEDVPIIFQPSRVAEANSTDVLIAIDTNVLLLPYTLKKDRLPSLQKFYETIKGDDRLFLPARVAREFITHRDRKLAELLKTIADNRSRINTGDTGLPSVLEGISGSEDLAKASSAMAVAKSEYMKALARIEDQVKSWSGDDPVTSIYAKVFDSTNIVSPSDNEESILLDWDRRASSKIPPGYKDRGKADGGIGDFLIWLSLLELGKTHQKDLIFITGDEKADWAVRVNGGGAYPRPELVAEYRKHSGGKNIRLAELHEILEEMEASDSFVRDVETAEAVANNEIRAVKSSQLTIPSAVYSISVPFSSVAEFDLPYGGSEIEFEASGTSFKFQVSEAGVNSVWIYPNPAHVLFKISTGTIGEKIDLTDVEPMSSPVNLVRGQLVVARNLNGHSLVARLVRSNQPQFNDRFKVDFVFNIFRDGIPLLVP